MLLGYKNPPGVNHGNGKAFMATDDFRDIFPWQFLFIEDFQWQSLRISRDPPVSDTRSGSAKIDDGDWLIRGILEAVHFRICVWIRFRSCLFLFVLCFFCLFPYSCCSFFSGFYWPIPMWLSCWCQHGMIRHRFSRKTTSERSVFSLMHVMHFNSVLEFWVYMLFSSCSMYGGKFYTHLFLR